MSCTLHSSGQTSEMLFLGSTGATPPACGAPKTTGISVSQHLLPPCPSAWCPDGSSSSVCLSASGTPKQIWSKIAMTVECKLSVWMFDSVNQTIHPSMFYSLGKVAYPTLNKSPAEGHFRVSNFPVPHWTVGSHTGSGGTCEHHADEPPGPQRIQNTEASCCKETLQNMSFRKSIHPSSNHFYPYGAGHTQRHS